MNQDCMLVIYTIAKDNVTTTTMFITFFIIVTLHKLIKQKLFFPLNYCHFMAN